MAPQSKGGQKFQKNKTVEHYKGRFLNTQKVHFMFFFAIRVPIWFVGLQVALL